MIRRHIVILLCIIILIKVLFQDTLDDLIVVDMILMCPLAGVNEPLLPDFLFKSQDTHAALVGLLGMLPFLKDFND